MSFSAGQFSAGSRAQARTRPTSKEGDIRLVREMNRDLNRRCMPTFMTHGGYKGPSSSSLSSSLAHCALDFLFFFLGLGSAGCVLQTEQSGTVCARISASISVPRTCRRQDKQLAVANDPWHWRTRVTPAKVSNVSMFWV